MLPCFALFAGVPRRQMNLGLGRENFSVIVNHVLFNTDMVHDNYFYAGQAGSPASEPFPSLLGQSDEVGRMLKSGRCVACCAGYILGEYTEENCPRYLKRENFAKMKKHLLGGKLHLFHGSIEQAIIKNGQDDDELFTVASLLVRTTLLDRASLPAWLPWPVLHATRRPTALVTWAWRF